MADINIKCSDVLINKIYKINIIAIPLYYTISNLFN